VTAAAAELLLGTHRAAVLHTAASEAAKDSRPGGLTALQEKQRGAAASRGSDTEQKTVRRLTKKLETLHNTCNFLVHSFRIFFFPSEFPESNKVRKVPGWSILEFAQPH